MVQTTNTFDDRYAEVKELVDRHNLDRAYEAAWQLVTDFPHRFDAYFILNYVVCVGDKHGGPHFYSPDVIDRAYQNVTDIDAAELRLRVGDMKRDRAIGLIRYAVYEFDLERAGEIIQKLRGDRKADTDNEVVGEHANDPNRMAVLLDVEGRLCYARGQYREAESLHDLAYTRWVALSGTGRVDLVFVYNNFVHWLKSIVALYGRNDPRAKLLARRIRTMCPTNCRNRSTEATVIRTPFVGNWLHDMATRRR
jgi:hypothetical protein